MCGTGCQRLVAESDCEEVEGGLSKMGWTVGTPDADGGGSQPTRGFAGGVQVSGTCMHFAYMAWFSWGQLSEIRSPTVSRRQARSEAEVKSASCSNCSLVPPSCRDKFKSSNPALGQGQLYNQGQSMWECGGSRPTPGI